ncbi:MAG: hypothetical protein KKG76_04025 [Euryarchaeota archaeon]|nr:hypothetical protein [Euryarchaeota archaeon]MBU4138521.1 hypothetical protein [Euryarchaeota archaeon]
METQTENNNKKNDPGGWKWLAYLSLSAAIIMILGIENALEKKTSFIIFALLTFLPVIGGVLMQKYDNILAPSFIHG